MEGYRNINEQLVLKLVFFFFLFLSKKTSRPEVVKSFFDYLDTLLVTVDKDLQVGENQLQMCDLILFRYVTTNSSSVYHLI